MKDTDNACFAKTSASVVLCIGSEDLAKAAVNYHLMPNVTQ